MSYREIRVRPVVRYIVTDFSASDDMRSQSSTAACCATRWSRSERSSICGMSGKDHQAWRWGVQYP